MASGRGKTTRRERRERRVGKGGPSEATATGSVSRPAVVDLAAIRVQGDAMAPAYCDGDVVIYRRPREGLTLRPGDDVLVLLSGPGGSLHLVLRRLARWDEEALELRALNGGHPPMCEDPHNAVLCGQVIGRLDRKAWG